MKVAKILTDLSERGALAHAYILETDEDVLAILKGVQDKLSIQASDIQHIYPTESISIKVDQVRAVQERLSRSPYGNKHLVVISPADRMNTATSNALLKVLEEPQGDTLFLLVTANSKQLLQTIRSRTQTIRMSTSCLTKYENHPDYHHIKIIYHDAPSLLSDGEDMPLALQLYQCIQEANGSIKPFSDITIDDTGRLLDTAILLVSAILKTNQSRIESLWAGYNELSSLKSQFQLAKNLNEKATTDRVALVLLRFAGYQL